MVEYNPEVLKSYADRLYAQAYLLVLLFTVLGGGIGVVIGSLVPLFRTLSHDDQSLLGTAVLIISTVIGLVIGCFRCLAVRIKAQGILCQVEIEANTRALAQPRAEQRRIA